jgi:hypothetical protein
MLISRTTLQGEQRARKKVGEELSEVPAMRNSEVHAKVSRDTDTRLS